MIRLFLLQSLMVFGGLAVPIASAGQMIAAIPWARVNPKVFGIGRGIFARRLEPKSRAFTMVELTMESPEGPIAAITTNFLGIDEIRFITCDNLPPSIEAFCIKSSAKCTVALRPSTTYRDLVLLLLRCVVRFQRYSPNNSPLQEFCTRIPAGELRGLSELVYAEPGRAAMFEAFLPVASQSLRSSAGTEVIKPNMALENPLQVC